MFTEDLSPFFSDFAEDASLAGVAVRVVMDLPGVAALDVITSEPSCTLPTASVPAAVVGQTLQVVTGASAGAYTVRQHLPDGTGISTLVLVRGG